MALRHIPVSLVLAALPLAAIEEGNTPRTMSRAEQEEFLRTAKPLRHKQVGKGVTGAERFTLAKGDVKHDAHFQKIDQQLKEFNPPTGEAELRFRDSYKYNIAAYELGKLLGIDDMIPPSVERRVFGTTGALTWWVDNVLMDETKRLKGGVQPPNVDNWNDQMDVVHIFDQLIQNMDRNTGNLLMTRDWKIEMIDHTRAFRISKKLRNVANVRRCDNALLAKMRALDKHTLEQHAGRWLDALEIAGLLARRDRLLEHIDSLVKQKGAENVLYDRPKP